MFLLTATLALAAAAQTGEALAAAAAQARPASISDRTPALAGVVTDGTITAAGQAFYRDFCAYWLDKPLNEMYAIAVREHLSARRGNKVVVEYAGRVVFQGALPPGRGQIRPLSQQAVDISYETVVNAEVQRLLFSDDELAPDEL
ncbi:MAG: CsgE family curli-type amyloid fiber assembly protein [Pseudomonadota bacterium]